MELGNVTEELSWTESRHVVENEETPGQGNPRSGEAPSLGESHV